MAIAGSIGKRTDNPLWLDNFRWKFVPVEAPVDAAQMNDVRLLGTIAPGRVWPGRLRRRRPADGLLTQ